MKLIALLTVFTIYAHAATTLTTTAGAPPRADNPVEVAQSDRTMDACNDPSGQCITTYGGSTGICRNQYGTRLSNQQLSDCVAGILGGGKASSGGKGQSTEESK